MPKDPFRLFKLQHLATHMVSEIGSVGEAIDHMEGHERFSFDLEVAREVGMIKAFKDFKQALEACDKKIDALIAKEMNEKKSDKENDKEDD